MRFAVLLAVVLSASCSRESIATAPMVPVTTPTTPSAGAAASAIALPSTPPKAVTSRAEWTDGARVIARGRVSQVPWQHVTTGVPGKRDAYFDLADEKDNQTVVYWKAPPTCPGEIEIAGVVIEVKSASKRPGQSKLEPTFHELQIDVDSARCVDE